MAVDIQEYSFEFPGEGESKRQAFRVNFPGLNVKIHGRNAVYPVIDLSATGLAFKDLEQSLSLGQKFRMDLYVKDKVWVQGLLAKIVRIRESIMVACAFEDMTRSQEALMDKLTLEIQKRWIDHRKRKQQEVNDSESKST